MFARTLIYKEYLILIYKEYLILISLLSRLEIVGAEKARI